MPDNPPKPGKENHQALSTEEILHEVESNAPHHPIAEESSTGDIDGEDEDRSDKDTILSPQAGVTNPPNGKLRLYNQFPRVYSTLADATADLARIGKDGMGYNTVWMNPLGATSLMPIQRFNIQTTRYEMVQGSLYATRDFSKLNTRMFPDLMSKEEPQLSGDPGFSSKPEKETVRAYTDEARRQGLVPMFDLVLNHVASDSPDFVTFF